MELETIAGMTLLGVLVLLVMQMIRSGSIGDIHNKLDRIERQQRNASNQEVELFRLTGELLASTDRHARYLQEIDKKLRELLIEGEAQRDHASYLAERVRQVKEHRLGG